ncbi:methyl-accepting chemotaxis protein, partial [Acidisphaera sp. L21]|uniref:HAMP domain-containing protein n=1 Tax=Acidisphaera sp. L21 TaxID=1641851 RepID=UPI00131D44C3
MSERISDERSKLDTLFSNPAAATVDTLQPLRTAQAAAESAMAAVEPIAGKLLPDITRMMDRLKRSADTAVDALAIPAPARSYDPNRDFVLAVDNIQQLLSELIDQYELAVGRNTPEFGQLVRLAHLSQQLREATGLRSALLSPALSDNAARLQMRDMDELSGQIAVLWRRIKLDVQMVSPPLPQILEARDVMARTIMGEGEVRYRSLITAIGQGQPFEMTPAQFRAWTTPMLANSLLLRNAVLQDLTAKFALADRRATAKLVIAIIVTVLAIFASLGASWQIIRRITRPLSRLTSVVTGIAEGDLLVLVPGIGREDEIGEMATAILVLRDRASEAALMQQTAAAGQQAKLAAAHILTTAAMAFEQASSRQLIQVQNSEETLKRTAQSLDTASQITVSETESAADGVAQAVANVEELAKVVQKVADTVHVVSDRMTDAVTAVGGASKEADAALIQIADLATVASQVSAVVDSIT